jgi:tRNA threonylcarbamoyladenosine biosynthesis protein TsaE
MITVFKKIISNIKETEIVAEEIFQTLKLETNFVVFFDGDLGAGKTFIISKLLKKFGVDDSVTSPTFVIFNEYFSEKLNRNFAHFDFYRLENSMEFFNRGFVDIAEDKKISSFIEWSDKIPTKAQGIFCGTKFLVKIKRMGKKGEREIEFFSF